MVIDIVRQAVQYKKKCSTESPLISEGEYCCACGEALRMLGDPDGLLEQVKTMATVKEVKDLVLPVLKKHWKRHRKSRKKSGFFIFSSIAV